MPRDRRHGRIGRAQTFFLMAVEDRVKAAVPVNMISATSQGGVCENAPNLRAGWTDFSNMVVGALMAPRPLLIVSATGDWTTDTPTEVYPAIKSIYRLFGAENDVENVHVDSPHNYNKDSREAMHKFFKRAAAEQHGTGAGAAVQSRVPQRSARASRARASANAIMIWISSPTTDRRRAHVHRSPAAAGCRFACGCARSLSEQLTFSLLAFRPKPGELLSEKKGTLPNGEKLVIGREGKGDRVPAVWLTPSKASAEMAPTLIVHPQGVEGAMSSPW
jgi:hypothetical protein